MSKTKVIICPYCGDIQPLADRCRVCMGLFEPLSRQATHNAMGPWFVRNPNRLFQPGCSYETLVRMIERSQVVKNTIVRGPTTRQFWTIAKRAPGIAHLLGYCHNCDASVDPGDHGCHACGVPFGAYLDRNFLGLPDVRPLPWEAPDIERPNSSESARSIQWHRAAEPVGLSSFASDEDLRATAIGPASSAAFAAGGSGGGSRSESGGGGGRAELANAARTPVPLPVATVLLAERTATVVQPTPQAESSVMIRSMRRRLDQQQRTIRSLVIVLIIAGVLAVVSLLVIAAGRGESSDATGASGNPSPSNRQDQSAEPAATAATSQADDSLDAGAAALPTTMSATTEDSLSPDEVQALLDDAAKLVEAASQADRSLTDRLGDLEEARQKLARVLHNAPASKQPADLKNRMKQVEAEIDRLRLKEFFP
jgi:hypothetical protein